MVATVAEPFLAAVIPIFMVFAYFVLKSNKEAVRETMRLQSLSRTPLLAHLGETQSGTATIRAF